MCKKIFSALGALLVLVGMYHVLKPLPDGFAMVGDVYTVDDSDVHFFTDTTFLDNDGIRVSEQTIFNEIQRMINAAEEYILIDMFFFSDFIGVESQAYRTLSSELTDFLIDKKAASPEITIQVITDPINVMYGGHVSADFARLEGAGIPVFITELRPLRDSNPLYSAVWRTFFQWFGNSDRPGYLPNPLDAESQKLGLRTYLKMLNYKANHRKVVVTDFRKGDQVGFSTLITSANPHDGSSAHSNIAVRVDSELWQDVLESEAAVLRLDEQTLALPSPDRISAVYESEGLLVTQLLTEGAIKDRVIAEIDATKEGDAIDVAMFYIADRDIVASLLAADARGVLLRLLFDPNKDAFGREKNGTPNRQVAHELFTQASARTEIRWCNTHGEQCHSKLLLLQKDDQRVLLQGSANYTRRNLDNFNLETNLVISGPATAQVFVDAQQFFNEQWYNLNDRDYSVPYDVYADDSYVQQLVYRFKEWTGLSRW